MNGSVKFPAGFENTTSGANPGPLLAFGLRASLFRSVDEGKSWEKVSIGSQAGITSGAVLPGGAILLATQAGEVFRSLDAGKTFTRLKPARPMAYYGVMSAPGGKAVMVGSEGARIYLPNGEIINAPGFPVEIYNILGAGDAFGGGFLYGYVNNWGWYKSARLGNACGAIVVTKHGCANFMPTMPEIEAFVAGFGGLE